MNFIIVLLFITFYISHGSECKNGLSVSQVESISKSYVGNIQGVNLTYDKKENICVYRIKGENGYIVIDATNGDILKFYKKRKK